MSTTTASETIVQEIAIKGSAERVFDALTDPDQRVKWWGVEGRFQARHMEATQAMWPMTRTTSTKKMCNC